MEDCARRLSEAYANFRRDGNELEVLRPLFSQEDHINMMVLE